MKRNYYYLLSVVFGTNKNTVLAIKFNEKRISADVEARVRAWAREFIGTDVKILNSERCNKYIYDSVTTKINWETDYKKSKTI